MFFRTLFARSAVDENGHWPVVYERHLHICAKSAAADRSTELAFQRGRKCLVERLRLGAVAGSTYGGY